jgi:hypothetical protein
MTAVSWALFLVRIMPELRELAQVLFQRHDGNVENAKSELRHVRDRGQQLKNFELEIAERMAALKARAAEGGQQ